jgi:hypothetical protein
MGFWRATNDYRAPRADLGRADRKAGLTMTAWSMSIRQLVA